MNYLQLFKVALDEVLTLIKHLQLTNTRDLRYKVLLMNEYATQLNTRAEKAEKESAHYKSLYNAEKELTNQLKKYMEM